MSSRVPTRIEGVDIMSLPLSTIEGFVLSRVDGHTSVDDIAMMTRVAEAQLLPILDRLADLGAVVLPWAARDSSAQAAVLDAPEARAEVSKLDIYDYPESPPRFDSRELEGDADIDRKTRRRILNAYYLLASRTFYELLGVANGADKKEIRAAYFELSKAFHPDVFFGQNLGAYRARIESVFQRLTEAYEVLGRRKRRQEYDAYLVSIGRAPNVPVRPDSAGSRSQSGPDGRGSVQPTVRPTRPSGPPVEVRPLASAEERKATMAARLRQRMDSVLPPRSSSPSPSPRDSVGTSEPGDSRAPSSGPEEVRGARSGGANSPSRLPGPGKLPGPGRLPRPGKLPSQGQSPTANGGGSAVHALRRALEGSTQATNSRLEKVLVAALAAEQAGDLTTAVEALQTVLEHNPQHVEALTTERRVQDTLERAKVAALLQQARYEQKRAHWAAAAESWVKVADLLPRDASAHRTAALANLQCGEDLHRARKYAEMAVQLKPEFVANLTTLARVFLATGHKINARRELEKAVKLNPNDELANNLLREVS